jgi:hypothetical protein
MPYASSDNKDPDIGLFFFPAARMHHSRAGKPWQQGIFFFDSGGLCRKLATGESPWKKGMQTYRFEDSRGRKPMKKENAGVSF